MKRGRDRGWVTIDEVNRALPPENLTPENIEAGMHRLGEMGIDVIGGPDPLDDLRQTTERALASLSPNERRILETRAGFGLEARSLAHVERDFAIVRGRIREIEARALRKLGHALTGGDGYSFRRIEEGDLPKLGAWLARPHVARWWGDPQGELEKIREHLTSPGVTGYLVTLETRPFAYLQCYDPSQDSDNAWEDQPEGTRGLDLFIGEEEFLGKGHGSALLRIFSDDLLARPTISRVIGDPDPANRASVGAFAKAGFRPAGEKRMPWGPVLLLVKERDPDGM